MLRERGAFARNPSTWIVSVLPRETRVLFRKHPFRARCFACECMASLAANHRARNLKSVQPVAHTFLHMKDIAEITRYVSNDDFWPNVHTRRERASRLPKVQIRVFQNREPARASECPLTSERKGTERLAINTAIRQCQCVYVMPDDYTVIGRKQIEHNVIAAN